MVVPFAVLILLTRTLGRGLSPSLPSFADPDVLRLFPLFTDVCSFGYCTLAKEDSARIASTCQRQPQIVALLIRKQTGWRRPCDPSSGSSEVLGRYWAESAG